MIQGYEYLSFSHDEGVTTITINRPEIMNAVNLRLHDELGRVWRDLADDHETRVAIITGAGDAFSAGADFELIESTFSNYEEVVQTMMHTRALVHNMLALDKPIISAINGVAVGAGLTVALMADISIIADGVRLTDGHARLGVAAGDHSAIVWPLLCGMAKAKWLLLTADFVDAHEAERIGLVSMCVPKDDLMKTAQAVAGKLASGPQDSIQWTKRSLNAWMGQAVPIFEQSLALEMLCLFGDDVREGVAALKEHRVASFPTTRR